MNLLHKLYHSIKYRILSIKYFFALKFCAGNLNSFLQASSQKKLVLTHNVGGGTETYVKNNFYDGTYLILRNCFYAKKDFCYTLENPLSKKIIYIPTKDFSKLMEKEWDEVAVNSLHSYYTADFILEQIQNNKSKYSKTKVLYLIHDFHCVCPNFTLIANNKFCNFDCPNQKCTFNMFKNMTTKSVRQWRFSWQSFLSCCDEIRAFSNSSKEIVLKAYPLLQKDKITVVPHSMEYCKLKALRQIQKDELKVAICGAINGILKGSLVVKDFLEYCKNRSSIKVFMIGSPLAKECKVKAKNIFYLGRYKSSDLGNMLGKNGINAVFFPSICPETFSYLVSELMFLDIPVVAFNIGAQGEKLRDYDKGFVISTDSTSEEIFCNLQKAMESAK